MALFSRACPGKHSLNGLFNRLCKVSKYNNVQVAHITGKLNRTAPPRLPPFNYKEKRHNFLTSMGYSIERMDENSRIIVVEGPIAAGKDKFCRELAEELDMGYMPATTFDRVFIDDYGNDVRLVQEEYPEKLQLCDIPKFLTNPRHPNAQAFQVANFVLKCDDYAESLLHLLSTGQGVIINRSAFSNFVFMKAMYKAGYMNQRCRKFYEKVAAQSLFYLMRPHLVIYLDVPVDIVEERIKKRAIPYEVNSEVLTRKFLTDIETIYKQEYLPQIESHAYVLMYDWSHCGDVGDVVDDIECIPLELDKQNEKKLEDWRMANLNDFQKRRIYYSREERTEIYLNCLVTDFEVEEMFLFGEDADLVTEMFLKTHGKYMKGYDAKKGDSVLWKLKEPPRTRDPQVISNIL